jgi:predicted DCC family thiol-disulfide oxidoreductase YuxK
VTDAPAQAPASAKPGLTVWYDGACPLCAREIALMRRLDETGQVNFVDLETTLDTPLPREAMLERFHVTAPDGAMRSGAAAFAALWGQLPATRPLGRLASWPPLLAVLEHAYDLFLRFRPRLQAVVRRWDARRQDRPG